MNACLCHALYGDIVVTSPPITGSVRCAVQVRCPAKAVYLRARRLVHNWHEREPLTSTNLRECIQSTHAFPMYTIAAINYNSYMLAVTLSDGYLYYANKTSINVLDVNSGDAQAPMHSPSSGDSGGNLTLIRVYAQQDLVVAGDYYGRMHIWRLSTGEHMCTLRGRNFFMQISDIVVHGDT